MDKSEVIMDIEKQKQEAADEIAIVAASAGLDIEKAVMPAKVKTLQEATSIAIDLVVLETQIAAMRERVAAQGRIEQMQKEARELAIQLASPEMKEQYYQDMRARVNQHIADIKRKYGI